MLWVLTLRTLPVGVVQAVRRPRQPAKFEAAPLEADPLKLPERVQAAETFIFFRLQELINSPDGYVERQALADAMRALRAIKTEKMNYCR
jgi:hypothetical protein